MRGFLHGQVGRWRHNRPAIFAAEPAGGHGVDPRHRSLVGCCGANGKRFWLIGGQKTGQEGFGVGIHQGHLAFVSARGLQDHRGQVGKAHGQRVADAVDHDGGVAASGGALDAARCILAAEDSANTIARKFSDGCRGRARRQWPSHLLRDVAGQHRRQHLHCRCL
jgi:hypothetical protein